MFYDSERSRVLVCDRCPGYLGILYMRLSIQCVVSISERAPGAEPVRVERVSVIFGPFEKNAM